MFRHKAVSQEALDELLKDYAPPVPNGSWNLDKSYLEYLLRHPKKSAPGPDGIPFLAYSAVPEIALRVLLGVCPGSLEWGFPA